MLPMGRWTGLLGPGGGFTFFSGYLGEWDSERPDLKPVAVLV